MEEAPKIPSPEDKNKAAELLRKAVTAASIGVAAISPINKVAAAPTQNAPVFTEKQTVRPKDLDDQVLKDEINAYSAKFEIQKDGEIKRIAGNKE